MKPDLMDLILEEVRTARPILLFKAFRHDKEIKRLLGVKKLRKNLFYSLADRKYIIRGKGNLVVYDEKTAQELLKRIKEKIRYAKEPPIP
jgi:hypothetical protein